MQILKDAFNKGEPIGLLRKTSLAPQKKHKNPHFLKKLKSRIKIKYLKKQVEICNVMACTSFFHYCIKMQF